MSGNLGRVLSNKPFVSQKATDIPVDTQLKARFDFHSAVLRNYVKYAQEIENLSKEEVLAQINPIIDELVSQYRFGAKFVNDIRKYVETKYHTTPAAMYATIRKDSALDEGVFGVMMEDLKESPILDKFSPQFRMIIG